MKKMTVSDSTLALLAHADAATVAAAKTGVKALLQLVTDNVEVTFKRGDATDLAGMLKKGGIAQHSAKRYADISVLTVTAIQMQANIASSKVKATEKAAAKAASATASLDTLRKMSDMRKVRQWAKENGPKADKVEKADKVDKVDAPTETIEPTAQAVEATGQLREVRETFAMLNSGQLTQSEALETIALIVGAMIIKPAKPAKPTTKPVKTGT